MISFGYPIGGTQNCQNSHTFGKASFVFKDEACCLGRHMNRQSDVLFLLGKSRKMSNFSLRKRGFTILTYHVRASHTLVIFFYWLPFQISSSVLAWAPSTTAGGRCTISLLARRNPTGPCYHRHVERFRCHALDALKNQAGFCPRSETISDSMRWQWKVSALFLCLSKAVGYE